jgi:hypothetical protein
LLEYLDTTDSDSHFILESYTNDTTEDAPHATSPAAHTVSDSEENDKDDEDYMEILSPEQPLPFPFQFRELSEPKQMPPLESPPIAYFHLFFTDLILILMVRDPTDMGNK